MKYALLVGDGMADYPVPELRGRTPLEAARTPHMDLLAREGIGGLVRTIPQGMEPGSDVANLSILGIDPLHSYTGRGPLEAASMGIEMAGSDVAFRCNLVTVADDRMVDYSGGHISSSEGRGRSRLPFSITRSSRVSAPVKSSESKPITSRVYSSLGPENRKTCFLPG